MVIYTLYKNTGLTDNTTINPNINPLTYLSNFGQYTFNSRNTTDLFKITIEKPYSECLDYDYAVIDGNIYCFVSNITYLSTIGTTIFLAVDEYTTNRDRITIVNGDLIRTTLSFEFKQKIVGRSKIVLKERNLMDFDFSTSPHSSAYVYYFRHDNSTNKNYIGQVDIGDLNEVYSYDFSPININEIQNIWFSPFKLNTLGWTDVNSRIKENEFDGFFTFVSKIIQDLPVEDDYGIETGITDCKGNVVWTTYRYTSKTYKSLYCYPIIGPDVFKWLCTWENNTTNYNEMFTVPCENISFFNDAYKEYQILQKPFTNELRQAQLETQLYQNAGQILSSAGTTGIGSFQSGGNPAVAMGVGALGQAVNTFVTYETNKQLNYKTEQIEDKQNKLSPDYLNNFGTALNDIMSGKKCMSLVSILRDDDAIDSFNRNKSDTGYDYNKSYNFDRELKPLIQNDTFIQGRFVVTGCNQKAKSQIEQRFLSGMYFKGDNNVRYRSAHK